MNIRKNMGWAGLASLSLVLGLHGCGGGGSENTSASAPASQFTVNTPAAIAQASADDYENNVNGLITAATLKRWKDDWANQKPAGVTGKLVILQVSAGPAGAEYIKPNGTNVFTYLSPGSSDWTQTRDNGVVETVSMVPDGANMDALLKRFNIDPRNDMIVSALGTGSTGNAMAQGRIWYALRYWGVDKKNLAILNGGNQWINTNGMAAGDFQAADSAGVTTTATLPSGAYPNSGFVSVKSLPVDNTQLQATMTDMFKTVVAGSDTKKPGVFLWDARSLGQYSAGEMVEKGEDTNSDLAGNQACPTAYCAPVNPNNYMWTFQNAGSRQGHPNGAQILQYTYMLDATKGYSYKPKAELAAYLAGETDASGIGFVGSNYATVGSGNAYKEGDTVYTYCETTMRAMITGVTSAVILGKPTRFYDGAMTEWNSLSHILDKNGNYILAENSPWRADKESKSFYRPADSYLKVNPRIVTDEYAASANAIVNADKAYKTGESLSGGGGATGGGVVPSSPCGG